MESISGQIKKQIIEGQEGKIYFVSDFNFTGNEDLVKKVLFRLEKNGILIRISHGIYLYPVRDVKLGVMYPSMDSIAQAIAMRDKADIRYNANRRFSFKFIRYFYASTNECCLYNQWKSKESSNRKKNILKSGPKKFPV